MELNKVIDLEALTASGFPEGLIEQASGFMELMMQYRCALMEVETKLNVLNAEFTMKITAILLNRLRAESKHRKVFLKSCKERALKSA